jgi:hypothetical protein
LQAARRSIEQANGRYRQNLVADAVAALERARSDLVDPN